MQEKYCFVVLFVLLAGAAKGYSSITCSERTVKSGCENQDAGPIVVCLGGQESSATHLEAKMTVLVVPRHVHNAMADVPLTTRQLPGKATAGSKEEISRLKLGVFACLRDVIGT